MIGYGGRVRKANRLAWELSKGPIPLGMYVLHRCDKPNCIEPRGLFLGTHQDNMDDMVKKGRSFHPRGELNGGSKLTEKRVKALRKELKSRRIIDVSRDSGISDATLWDIKHRKTWRHV